MKLEKTAFLNAMRKALPGVEKGASIIDGADTFVFSKDSIHTYNDSISVSVPFATGLEGAVKSMDFFKLVSKLNSEDLDVECGDIGVFKIKAGLVEAEMANVQNNLAGYISTLNIGTITWKEIPAGFFEAVRLCKISGNKAPQRGIFVEKNYMISTDVSRINHHLLPVEMERFWIDDPAVNELMKIDGLTKYSISESWAHFQGSDGTIFSIKRKDDAGFPVARILSIIETHKKNDTDLENELPEGLYNVADRVSTLASELDGLPAIKMTVNRDNIEFFSERSAGKVKEKINLKTPFKQPISAVLWVDPAFLIEVSRKVSGFYLRTMTGGNGKTMTTMVFHNKEYMQVASTFAGEGK